MSRTGRTIGLSLLLAIALLGVGEVLARVLWTPPPIPWLEHPLVGRVRPANYRATKVSVDDGKPFEYETNVLAMRGKSITKAKKDAGAYRAIFVGGSTSENPNTREEQTFPALVEKELNERLKGTPRVEVGNCGVSGNLAAHTLAHVAHRVLPLEPDLVVCLEVNDFYASLSPGWDPSTMDMARFKKIRFKDWFEQSSSLYAWANFNWDYDLFDAKKQYERYAKLRRSREKKDPPEAELLRGLPRFKETLHRIALLCDDARVPIAFMTAVWLYKEKQPDDEDQVIWLSDISQRFRCDLNLSTATARRGVDAYNDAIREVARQHHAILVDLDRDVPHDLAHLVDDVHFSAKGHEVAAKAILKEVLRDGALPGHAR